MYHIVYRRKKSLRYMFTCKKDDSRAVLDKKLRHKYCVGCMQEENTFSNCSNAEESSDSGKSFLEYLTKE